MCLSEWTDGFLFRVLLAWNLAEADDAGLWWFGWRHLFVREPLGRI